MLGKITTRVVKRSVSTILKLLYDDEGSLDYQRIKLQSPSCFLTFAKEIKITQSSFFSSSDTLLNTTKYAKKRKSLNPPHDKPYQESGCTIMPVHWLH